MSYDEFNDFPWRVWLNEDCIYLYIDGFEKKK